MFRGKSYDGLRSPLVIGLDRPAWIRRGERALPGWVIFGIGDIVWLRTIPCPELVARLNRGRFESSRSGVKGFAGLAC